MADENLHGTRPPQYQFTAEQLLCRIDKRRQAADQKSTDDPDTWIPIHAWLQEEDTSFGGCPDIPYFGPRFVGVLPPFQPGEEVPFKWDAEEIQEVLFKHQLRFNSIGVGQRRIRFDERRIRWGEPNSQLRRSVYWPTLTITVRSTLPKFNKGDLRRAAEDVYKHLLKVAKEKQGKTLDEIFVEVIATGRETDSNPYSIKPDHPGLSELVALQFQIVEAAKLHLATVLFSVGIYMMDSPVSTVKEDDGPGWGMASDPLFEPRKYQPTIAVTVDETKLANFDRAMMAFKQLAEAANPDSPVQIRLLATQYQDGKIFHSRTLGNVTKLYPGTPIVAEGENWSGVAGPFVYLQKPGHEPKKAILTTAHVALDRKHADRDDIQRKGLAFGEADPEIIMLCPGRAELEAMIQNEKNSKDRCAQEIRRFEQTLEEEPDPKKEESLEDSIRRVHERLQRHQEEIDILCQARPNLAFGRTLATSPIEVVKFPWRTYPWDKEVVPEKEREIRGQTRMDWGLIELTSESAIADFGTNMTPKVNRDWMEDTYFFAYYGDKPITMLGQIDRQYNVYLNGTLVSGGLINGAKTYYAWPQDSLESWEWDAGARVDQRRFSTNWKYRNVDFGQPGDSGGWIVDTDEQMLGLHTRVRQYNGRGIVIPIIEVMDDIERRTGWKVLLPGAEEPMVCDLLKDRQQEPPHSASPSRID